MTDKKHMKHLLDGFNPTVPFNALADIFEKQKKFASKWTNFDNREDINYYRKWVDDYSWCIVDEISEVINWLPWKHWKDYTGCVIDIREVRFELIDILHFVVNICLLSDVTQEDLQEHCSAKGSDIKSLMRSVKATFIQTTGEDLPLDDEQYLCSFTKEYLGKINRIISTMHLKHETHTVQEASNKLVWRKSIESKKDSTDAVTRFRTNVVKPGIMNVFTNLLVLFQLWSMTANDVWVYYAAKNKENYDRQERGYKEVLVELELNV